MATAILAVAQDKGFDVVTPIKNVHHAIVTRNDEAIFDELMGTTVQSQPEDIPGVAAGIGFLKNMIRADVRATGMAYSGSHVYEVDAYASFAPFPFLRLQGGYKHLDLKVDESDVNASLKLSGPYAGLQLSF